MTRVPVSELSDPRFRAGGAELFSPDLFHPNEAGHRIWAELFSPYLAATIHAARIRDMAARRGA